MHAHELELALKLSEGTSSMMTKPDDRIEHQKNRCAVMAVSIPLPIISFVLAAIFPKKAEKLRAPWRIQAPQAANHM